MGIMHLRTAAVLLVLLTSLAALLIHADEASALDETVVEGWVFDQDIMPVANVSIKLESGSIIRNAITDSQGYFKIRYVSPFYNYTITAYSDWTTNFTENLTLAWGTTNSLDLYVDELDLCGLEGQVRMISDGRGAYNTAVHFQKEGHPSKVAFADVEGFFRFNSVPSGYCTIIFELGGYDTIVMEDRYLVRGEWNYINAQLREISFDIVSVFPKDGSTGVSVTESIKVTFSLPLEPDTVDGSNFFIKDAVSERILNSYLYLSENGTEVDMVHEEYFDHETLYTLYISEDVENIYNSRLGRTVKINFTTEIQPQAFQVDSKYPPTDATDVSTRVSVRVGFPHAINQSSLNDATVQLFRQGSLAQVAVTMVYYQTNRTLLIDPDEPLEPSTRYSVILSTMIRSAEKDLIFTGYSWSFETRDEVSDKGILMGYVQAADGSLDDIGDIWVTISNGKTSRQTYLDLNGRYTFVDVDPGPWTVTVSGGNYIETSTTEFVRAGETSNADMITLVELEEQDDEADLVTICVMSVLIILIVLIIIVVLARKNTKDEQTKGASPPLKVPPARAKEPITHTVVDVEEKNDEMVPVGVGSSLDDEEVEEDYLLDEEVEDFDITPGPVVDEYDDEVEEELLDDQLHTLKERIKDLEADIPFVEEREEEIEDEDLYIDDDEFDGEEFDEEEIGGPAPGAVESEPVSSGKPRMLQAPPGFGDE